MNDNIVKLSDFYLCELEAWLSAEQLICQSMGEPGPVSRRKYRGKQLFEWLGMGARSFDEMTNLPLALRSALAARAITGIPEIVAEARSRRDGTVKYAMKTHDDLIIECVLMQYRHGATICVSSQAGCAMGCAFCATKPQSFARGLSPGEMLGQVVLAANRGDVNRGGANGGGTAGRIGNVVVMGIGEPFNNYDNTLKFIRLAHGHKGLGIGYRKFTISTCGVLSGILRLAEEGIPVGLAVSLHAPDDATRGALMPVNHSCSIDKLIEGCKIYTCKTGRRVTFEYALMKGVNDAPDDARGLLRIIRGMLCHINLIPMNQTDNTRFVPSSRERVAQFAKILTDGGAAVTVRRELGTDIMAACGQLRNTVVKL
ncbi:MAG: 23S rRNA (adenine(2503)-C(2))-methyltransferase RlmN [Oscillospiraceae bacterium]|nr:23S rRNA (adenine(2503)-C(2))-methyltransferase RlmN [Oscillospiraceae bacterium]